MSEQSPIKSLLTFVRDALASWPNTTVDEKSVVMGLACGLRLAKHHPEYAIALGDQLQAHFEADRPGVSSWPDDIARVLPEYIPLSQVGGNGKEAGR